MQGREVIHSSAKQDWATPRDLFRQYDKEFGFVLDAAASDWNACCKRYFTEEQNGLTRSWDYGGAVWCNPPYSRRVGDWVKKGYEESEKHHIPVVMLLFARTDTEWFHKYVYGKAEVRFLQGRLRFLQGDMTPGDRAPAPSMIVVWGGQYV